MAHSNPALTAPPSEPSELLPDTTSWRDVVQLLRQAARLAAERGSDSEQFMQAAWAACLEARPGLREELADKELRAQLKKLRKRGLIGIA
jgi:hypothetical protein